jgi:Fic family protein
MALATDERRVVRLYSMSARFMDQRDAYYAALERTSSGDLDITPWLLWFLEQVEAAIRSSESLVAAIVHKARFWMRHTQDKLNERQLKALNRMLDAEPGGFVAAVDVLGRPGTSLDGGPCRDRTYDQLIKSQLLYQLS